MPVCDLTYSSPRRIAWHVRLVTIESILVVRRALWTHRLFSILHISTVEGSRLFASDSILVEFVPLRKSDYSTSNCKWWLLPFSSCCCQYALSWCVEIRWLPCGYARASAGHRVTLIYDEASWGMQLRIQLYLQFTVSSQWRIDHMIS